MKLTINDIQKIEIFASLFQNIKSMTELINIQFLEEKMYIQTLDSAKVSILEIILPNTWFCEYECIIPVTLGVNTNIMYKILSARDKTQSINIEYNDDEDHLFFHHTSSNDTSIFDRKFEMPLIDIDTDIMEITTTDYQVELSLSSSKFNTLISQLSKFGESLEFNCSETIIQLISNSPESGSMKVEVKIEDLSSFAIEEGNDIVSSFGLQYLTSICQYYKIAPEIEIKLHMENPLCIEYHLNDDGHIRFFLAPKINDN